MPRKPAQPSVSAEDASEAASPAHTPPPKKRTRSMKKVEPASTAEAHASSESAVTDEETAMTDSLIANDQVAAEHDALKLGQTHQMQRAADGTLKPVRKRFSAI
jgi:hypothetical protein